MPGLADWPLPAVGATVVVVIVAAVATLRGSAPSRPFDRREPDLRNYTARLAGPVADAFASLTAIDTLARNQPEYRPAVVALLAEHLRGYSDRGDDAVTQAVQRCLISHAKAHTRPPCPGTALHLDLTGAHLRDLDLSALNLHGLSLAHARLAGTTRLDGLSCEKDLDATSALFSGDLVADFLHVVNDLRLARSVLDNVNLTGAFAQEITDLTGAQVTGTAWLTGAVLPTIRLCASGPSTETAAFIGPVDLQGTVCDDIRLHGTEFHAGLTITLNQATGTSREIAARDPDTATLVRRALFYELGSNRQV